MIPDVSEMSINTSFLTIGKNSSQITTVQGPDNRVTLPLIYRYHYQVVIPVQKWTLIQYIWVLWVLLYEDNEPNQKEGRVSLSDELHF